MSSKAREALDKIGNISAFVAENCGNAETAKYMNDIISIVQETLSEPLKNCEVGTAEEQSVRFYDYCLTHSKSSVVCLDCPLCDKSEMCEFAWAQLPYESEVKR
jgi:hypothetical protein